jgi:hypothetical protein
MDADEHERVMQLAGYGSMSEEVPILDFAIDDQEPEAALREWLEGRQDDHAVNVAPSVDRTSDDLTAMPVPEILTSDLQYAEPPSAASLQSIAHERDRDALVDRILDVLHLAEESGQWSTAVRDLETFLDYLAYRLENER